MGKKSNIIGIDLGYEKIQAGFFDNTCVEPLIIANSNGIEVFSEDNIKKVFNDLKDNIGCEYTQNMVIAIPGAFNYMQRGMIKNIALENNINISRFIHKSSAAATAFGYELTKMQDIKDKTIVVCIIDEGLFEVAIAEIGEGVIEMCAIDWDNNFNEKDIDIEKFNTIFENIILTRKNQLVEAAISRGESDYKIKFTVDEIDDVLFVANHNANSILKPLVTDFFNKTPNISYNTERLIVNGASIQAAILNGDIKDVLLLDITSLSFWIRISDDKMIKVINRNTAIPTRSSFDFSVSKSNSFAVEIFQGESEHAAQNCCIGNIILPKLYDGDFDIVLDIDANGILHVTIIDTLKNKEVYSTLLS